MKEGEGRTMIDLDEYDCMMELLEEELSADGISDTDEAFLRGFWGF